VKILFNRVVRRTAWGGGAHFHSAMVDLLEEKGYVVTNKLEKDVDVIFMLDPRYEEGGFDWNVIKEHKIRHPHVKVLHRINECDARNGGANRIDSLLAQANTIADHTIFISAWLQKHLSDKGVNPLSSEVIYNGCRLDWFFPNDKTELLSHQKIRLVTHHWSDNRLKGFDLYDALDKYVEKHPEFEFTYIGRYNQSYAPKNTHILSPMYGSKLGDELRKHDIYITASRNEPAGMHHVEGAASGLPVLFHADGGGIVECASKHGLPFNDPISFHDSLTQIVKHYNKFRNRISRDELSLRLCCERYLAVVQKMVI